MVLFSFRPPNADYLGFPATTEGIVESACKAEEQGFDCCMVNDHILVQDVPQMVTYFANTYDPLMVLSYLAAKTSRIRLGTSVMIMPYRNPMSTAKMFSTLDQMSGGRAIAGVGAGGNELEYNALKVPFHERGSRTNEYLRIWKACWAPGLTTFKGKYFEFEDMHVLPKPVQQPHVPIWVGGFSQGALRRAARFSDTWAPTPMPLPDLLKNMAYLKEASDKIGRSGPPMTRMSFRVNFTEITGNSHPEDQRPTGQGTPDQIIEDMLSYRREAGLEAFQVNFNGSHSLQQLLDSMDLFTNVVRPAVEAG
jgi:probable F420-dependent oxidoreductase